MGRDVSEIEISTELRGRTPEQADELLDLGTTLKVVNRSGAWFKYHETYLGQGKEKARAFLLENKDVCEQIKDEIMSSGDYTGPEGPAAIGADASEADTDAALVDS